jgi:hypothetical protein
LRFVIYYFEFVAGKFEIDFMPKKVRIPTPLRKLTNSSKSGQASGAIVRGLAR